MNKTAGTCSMPSFRNFGQQKKWDQGTVKPPQFANSQHLTFSFNIPW